MTAQPESGAHLRRPWLIIARGAWIVVAALHLGVAALTLYSLAYNLRLGGPGFEYRYDQETQETIIKYIYPASPAAETGLQAGDTVLAVNGGLARRWWPDFGAHRLQSGDRVLVVNGALFSPDDYWEAGEPGSPLTLTVRTRDGRLENYTLTLRAGWHDWGAIGALLSGLPLDLYATSLLALEVVVMLVFGGVAALIFWRRSGDWVGLLFSTAILLLGTNFGISGFVARFGVSFLSGAWEFLPSLVATSRGLLGSILITLFILLFPDGRFVPRWAWPLAIAQAALQAENAFLGFLPVSVGTLALGCCGVSVLAFQVYRYVRVSTPTQRQQTKWVVVGVAIWGISTFALILWTMFSPPGLVRAQVFSFGALLGHLPFLALSVCLGLAIFRYRLWDIDLLINRTLVYGALTAGIIGTYALVVGVLGAMFRSSNSLPLSILATGLIALIFQPLRQRLQRGVNRLMYGERDDPYAVLARLGQGLEATLAAEAVLPTIVETIAQALKLPYVAIALAATGDSVPAADTFTVVAAHGSPTPELVRLPLVYQHETVGQLIVGPRAGETFSPADQHLLSDLARQAGVAAYAVRLTTDLQWARERLVTTREEERRRLRRDLHDGLGQQLAALNLQVGRLRTLIPRDAAAADVAAVELRTDIHAAIADIRRLVYELRPPTLDELGLVGALRTRAAQCASSDGLQVAVDAPEHLSPLPAAVEVAAYRIAQEALTNVVRHAQARTCVIRLTLADGLRLEIRDDGIGLPVERSTGVGLRSMRERAAELGGTCVIEIAPGGGTQVLVRFPLPPGPG